MKIYVDTSAILAVLDRDDDVHRQASRLWNNLVVASTVLVTSNYALLEASALIQRRLGMRFVHVFEEDFVPSLTVTWVGKAIHGAGVTMMRAANRRKLSLVDCVGFALCRRLRIDTVFAFDVHFREQGLKMLS